MSADEREHSDVPTVDGTAGDEPTATTPTGPGGDAIAGPIVGRRTGLAIGIAFVLANASNYSFQIIAGRQLEIEEYGVLGGFMAVITIITVSTSALQVIAARALAAGETVPSTRRVDGLTRSALKATTVLAFVVALASPLLARVLRVGVLPVILLGVYVIAASLDSIAAGRLQGTRRFRGLAFYSASQAIVKVLFATVVLLLGAKVLGLLGAIITGAALVAIIALQSTTDAGNVETHVLGDEARRSFAALVLFWLLISIDVPIARITFDPVEAGLYAAGAVLGKAVLWLPIVVAQLVFPSLAQVGGAENRSAPLMRRAFILVGGISAISVIGLIAVGEPVYRFLYGDRYGASADIAWKLGLAVIPLAFVNLLMLLLLARKRADFLKWFVAATVVQVVLLQVVPPTPNWYAASLAGVGVALLVPVALLARGGSSDDDPSPGVVPTETLGVDPPRP